MCTVQLPIRIPCFISKYCCTTVYNLPTVSCERAIMHKIKCKKVRYFLSMSGMRIQVHISSSLLYVTKIYALLMEESHPFFFWL